MSKTPFWQPGDTWQPPIVRIKGVDEKSPVGQQLMQAYEGKIKQFYLGQARAHALGINDSSRGRKQFPDAMMTYTNMMGQEIVDIELRPEVVEKVEERLKSRTLPDWCIIDLRVPDPTPGIVDFASYCPPYPENEVSVITVAWDDQYGTVSTTDQIFSTRVDLRSIGDDAVVWIDFYARSFGNSYPVYSVGAYVTYRTWGLPSTPGVLNSEVTHTGTIQQQAGEPNPYSDDVYGISTFPAEYEPAPGERNYVAGPFVSWDAIADEFLGYYQVKSEAFSWEIYQGTWYWIGYINPYPDETVEWHFHENVVHNVSVPLYEKVVTYVDKIPDAGIVNGRLFYGGDFAECGTLPGAQINTAESYVWALKNDLDEVNTRPRMGTFALSTDPGVVTPGNPQGNKKIGRATVVKSAGVVSWKAEPQ